jgi:hypothetical protein
VTYLSAEQSVEDSEPRELFVIAINDDAQVWRHTSASHDISYGGDVYTAISLDREEVAVSMPERGQDLTLLLPIDHAFARRWTQGGVPPMKATLTVYSQNGGETETIWLGEITSMGVTGALAKFNVPSRAGEWMLRPLPAFVASRSCPHFVFDGNCGVSRTGSGPSGLPHKVSTTVLSVNGRDIRVDMPTITASDPLRAEWAVPGELRHLATNEWVTIHLQTDENPGTGTTTVLRLENLVAGMAIGDVVEIYAGCYGDVATCREKFDNKENFGGLPQLPLNNPFTPQGWGVLGNV